VLGGQDLIGLGGAAQARRLDHGGPVDVVGLDADLAHAHAGAQRDRHPSRSVSPRDRLLDADRGGDARARGHEHRHHAVAEALDDRAPVLGDHAGDELVVLAAHLVGLVVADPTAHRGRVDEIGEEHRHGCRARLQSRHRAESYDGWRRPAPVGRNRRARVGSVVAQDDAVVVGSTRTVVWAP
jgi:hypothetical protein